MGLSTETATGFYHACESGKGWSGCAEFCHPDAAFSAQAGALAEMKTLEEYCDWMAGVLTIMPDASYDLKTIGTDEANARVTIFGVFHGTHTADGGPVPPTGKKTESDYVYVADMRDGKITHVTKIWNDGWAFNQLGWA